MKRHLLQILIIAYLLTLAFIAANAQSVNITASPASGGTSLGPISFDGNPIVQATAYNFNGGLLPTGWKTSPYTVSNNICPTKPTPDNTSYFWATNLYNPASKPSDWSGARFDAGGEYANKRFVETSPVNVSTGGKIEFYIRYGNEGAPCEQPDASNEEVYLQYSTNGGSTWVTIFEDWNTTSGGNFAWYNWYFNSIDIPVGARTTSTIFRWYQPANSGSSYDNWGLEDVSIGANAVITSQAWTVDGSTINTTASTVNYTFPSPGTYNVGYSFTSPAGNASGTLSYKINTTPTLDPITNQTVTVGGGSRQVNLSGITTGGLAGQTLSVIATSSNTAVVPNPSVSYTSPNTTGTITYTPQSAGTSTITVTARYTNDQTVAFSRTFTITVLSLSVTAPANTQFPVFTNNIDPGDFVISGFGPSDNILVSIGLENVTSGTNFSLPTNTGLTRSFGYDSWTNITEISFTGTQANANAALAAMVANTGADGNVKINVSASLSDVNYARNPENGHFYRYIASPGTNYASAKAAAAAMTYQGVSGYLVTITSTNENNFVNGNIVGAQNIWIGLTDEAVEGVWRWDTGPEAGTISSYYNWCGSEPNNAGGGENHVVTAWNGGSCWNDLNGTNSGSIGGYVVEFGDGTGAENQMFNFSASSSSTVSIVKYAQTYTFPVIPTKSYTDPTFTLGDAQTDRSLTITYTAADPTVVSITGNQATILKVGSTDITATQAGDVSNLAAPTVVRTLTVVDQIAPVANGFTPADDATETALRPTLSMTFDEAVTLGTTGTLTLYDGSTVLASFDLSDPTDRAKVILAGDGLSLSIALETDLPYGTAVSVEVSSGFVKDQYDNDFDGITATSNTWNFTTMVDVVDPVITVPSATTRVTDTGACDYTVQGTEFDVIAATDNSGAITALRYSIQRMLPNPNLITENFDGGAWNSANFEIGTPSGSVVNGGYQSAPFDDRGTLRTVADFVPTPANPLHVSATLTFEGFSIAFIGTRSDGLKNPFASNEPTNGAYFRLHNFNEGQTNLGSTSLDGKPGDALYADPVRIHIIDNGINISGTITNTVTNEVFSFNENTTFSSGSWRIVFSGASVIWDDIKISLGAHEYLQEVANGTNSLAGESLGQGENTIIWTAEDAAGNEASDSLVVTVNDNQNPVFVAPSNVIETSLQNEKSKAIAITDVVVTDNCAVETLTWAMTGATTATGSGQIGTYTFNTGLTNVTYTATDGAGNQATSDFTVSLKEAQTITFDALVTKSLQDADFDLTATASSGLGIQYVSSDPSVATISGSTVSIVGLGTTTITASQAGNAAYLAASDAVQTLEVVKITQTIDFPALAAKTFGETAFILGPEQTDKGLTVTYTAADPAVISIVGNEATILNAGNTTITATQAGDATHFAATAVDRELVVNKASLTITADDKTKVYGEANPTLTFSYTGLVNGDTEVTTLPSISTTATASSAVGTYTITLADAADANYDITLVAGELEVTKASLTITADDKTKVYGQANPTLTFSYTGLVNGDTEVTTLPSISTTATASSAVGTYAITLADAADANYDITLVAGELEVTKASLTITADDKTKVYGQANPTLTFSYTGLVNGDTEVTTLPSISTTATASSAVGTYAITLADAADANYDITLVAGELEVTKASLTITADDKTKVYGEANPALTFSYTGLVNGDTEVTTLPSISTTATASSAVGTYAITLADAADVNYDITLVAGELEVTKASLTITADDKTKVYGEANPTLTFSYTGLVNGDTEVTTLPSISTTATASSAVGTYAITLADAADANYDITLVAGELEVTKASLTITADDKTKVYGEANPTLTFSYTGLVNGDTEVTTLPSISTTATASSAVGSYAITLADAADANYDISYTSGTLTIIQAVPNLTWNDITATYGVADFRLTPPNSASPGAFTYTIADQQVAVLTGDMLSLRAMGVTTITATQAETANFEAASVTITLTVINATPTEISISRNTFMANQDPSTAVATFSTSDIDDTQHSYYLVIGDGAADNEHFSIIGNGLYLNVDLLQAMAGRPSVRIRVRSVDPAGNFIEQAFTLIREEPAVEEIFVPNTITPNGDGMNDEWMIPELIHLENVNIKVFDRDGRMYFETTDPSKGWDATYKGRAVNKGVYYYIVEVIIDGRKKVLKGNILIL
ncbi:MBG domain-containing protein [Penaeicola halotolerans]|uniref:MBG domain-containing protein n=1 Tax=Penaeicola halotolerans TaxID=2793196 RepID=UPI001CF8FC90|nr:MBG domain-containing protein [Penaeicola halotolerans]